ncbi:MULTISPECIES: hypothetical protein [unclassified Anabaena]|uniref:hypothetical protein n=1 Tax=unclassified Anabaena TaxID=2619674 RepID=UPI001447DF9B|nr:MULTISPECIES: hypothetical protein [unclassified Anabaena]MTJ09045.1 hypothetical protein [Anabaena sp. UHCC 0204]MTJ52153.1 hypothetical protein [Anabaena sp. UHCC 0253]
MKAVVTLCVGDAANRRGEITHPFLRAYAEKIGANFVVINNLKMGFDVPYFEKYQISNLVSKHHLQVFAKDHPFQSYIIHYTGKGHRKQGTKIEQIKKDLSIINNKVLAAIISMLPFIEHLF